MTSSDRCSLYLHRFGAFEMSLSNTLWKYYVQVIHPYAIISSFFFFSILCQCNVYWTWCSIKCVNRLACNSVCVLHLRLEDTGFKYIRPLLCNWNSGEQSRISALASFHCNSLCNPYWTDKHASDVFDMSRGNVGIQSNDEKPGCVCGTPTIRKPVKKWKWSHLKEVRPYGESKVKAGWNLRAAQMVSWIPTINVKKTLKFLVYKMNDWNLNASTI